MDYQIDLLFDTDLNKTLTITVPNADPDVSGAAVAAAMTRIVNAHAVTAAAGEPVAVKKAELVAVETTDYDLA